MENKYFTPDIEDICIGYEYEHINVKTRDWEKTKIANAKILSYFMHGTDKIISSVTRVPYLTKEQIETEGWKFNYNLGDFDYYIKTVNDEEYELEFCYKERININIGKRTLYQGKCKDINTFRKIIKLLEI
jgi:hypothetical protein